MIQAPYIYIDLYDDLEGHYKFGYDIGVNYKYWIKKSFDNDFELQQMKNFVNNNPIGDNIFNNLVNESTKLFPFYTMEIKGIANGANIPFKLMLINQLREELSQWIYDDENKIGHCTTIYSFKKNKISLLAHNDDWTNNYRKLAYCIIATVYKPNSNKIKYKFITWTYPGNLPGCDLNINSYGIAYTCNSLFPKKYNDYGVGLAWISRNMLRSKSIKELINKASNNRVSTALSYNIGNIHTSKLYNLEVNTGGEKLLKVIKNTYFHANMFRNINTEEYDYKPSIDSLNYWKKNKPFYINKIRKCLSNPIIFRNNNNNDKIYTEITGIFDFINKKLSLWAGTLPASHKPSVVLSIDKYNFGDILSNNDNISFRIIK